MSDKEVTRRTFIAAVVGAGIAGVAGSAFRYTSDTRALMPQRKLGRTEAMVSILGFGGFPISNVSIAEAVRIINRAIDLGVNYIDTASSYRDCEVKIGNVMRSRRAEVFLNTKLIKRDRPAAKVELENSIDRLQTDVIDSVQIHAVNTMDDLDSVTRSGGCLEVLTEARNEGRVRFIGITGHRRADVLVEALNRFDFDTVMIPVSLADAQVHDFEPILFPVCSEKNVGIVLMKTLAAGRLVGHVAAEDALRWAFSRNGAATSAVGIKNLAELETAVKTAVNFRPVGEVEAAGLLANAKSIANTEQLWWKR